MRRPPLLVALCALAGACPLSAQTTLGESAELVPLNPDDQHQLGLAVTLDGDTLVVGAPEAGVLSRGWLYAYRHDGTAWQLEERFTTFAPQGHQLGRRLSLFGDTVIVGGRDNAYAFVRNGTDWSLQGYLPHPQIISHYATDVSLSGDVAVVCENNLIASRAWIWERTGNSWDLLDRVGPDHATAPTGFGVSAAVSGDVLAVGAPFDPDLGALAGAVHVFTRNGDAWVRTAKLHGTPAFAGQRFGFEVSMDRRTGPTKTLAVGAVNAAHPYVFVFRGSGDAWVQEAVLSPPYPQSEFGFATDVSGETLVVGAKTASPEGIETGVALVYRRCGTSWFLQEELRASAANGGDEVGAAVTMSGERAVVGAPNHDDTHVNEGRAFVFELGDSPVGSTCHGDGSTQPCPCGNRSAAGLRRGCTNSMGRGAQILSNLEVAVSTDLLAVFGAALTPARPAVLLAGDTAAPAVFGDGLLCVGGPLTRLGIRVPGAEGDAVWGPGLSATGGWTPGDQRALQVLYRDPPGPCGAESNLTNALTVTFAP
ncbi:MAG: FG-GAP repeat protein [Planctomycetota bacterium]|jgi:hypothetical protein|nr:FG-GAP repeat protein [Planctomycetota bacterium]